MENASFVPTFLAIESEMGDLFRKHDWHNTTLKEPDTWPYILKSKLNTMMSSSFPMLLFWGSEHIFFYNDAFRPTLGVGGMHPALGQKGKIVWGEAWNLLGPLVNSVLNTGKAVWMEDQQIPFFRNGQIEDVYWTSSYSPVMNEFGVIFGVHVICNETTEKVNLLRKVEESNRLYTSAVDGAELGTWDLDPITQTFLTNDRLKNWLGLEGVEHINLSIAMKAVVEQEREQVAEAIQNATDLKAGGSLNLEFTIASYKTGRERIVRAVGKAVLNEHGQVIRVNGTLQDITAEVAATKESQKLSILVENSVDLMAILKMDGKNSYINTAGRALLGIDETEDVTQIPISEFHTPEQLEFVQTNILPSVLKSGSWTGVFGIKNRKTGEIIPLRNDCHRIDDEKAGEAIGVGAVMRDIRPEVNTREKLEELVRERTKELVRLNEELERKNKDLTSFAFVSSHDLQEPLRKINMFVSRIQGNDSLTSERNAEFFEKIVKSVKRMQGLIDDLLNFSRIGASEVEKVKVDLNDLVSDSLSEYQHMIEATEGGFQVAHLPVVAGTPFQIRQLFNNLISNSIKFARKGIPLQIQIDNELVNGSLEENLSFEKPYWKVSFKDNGIGFQPEFSEKIFEVFQRLHTQGTYEGTGIGLAICKRIMEHHNGFIKATSTLGKGATFELYFPLYEE